VVCTARKDIHLQLVEVVLLLQLLVPVLLRLEQVLVRRGLLQVQLGLELLLLGPLGPLGLLGHLLQVLMEILRRVL